MISRTAKAIVGFLVVGVLGGGLAEARQPRDTDIEKFVGAAEQQQMLESLPELTAEALEIEVIPGLSMEVVSAKYPTYFWQARPTPLTNRGLIDPEDLTGMRTLHFESVEIAKLMSYRALILVKPQFVAMTAGTKLVIERMPTQDEVQFQCEEVRGWYSCSAYMILPVLLGTFRQ